ncbi:unnamed protein product [Brassica rapa]|uniref:non-specific serine/threonine protein kinase n=4 Tax=Brassica TaxID=3705 RepID=A0A816XLP7_BRANA|nr:unnamed protein product [Brassica napus]CAG7886673.1 unnamed protein product [Brassica rapa]
MRKQGLGNLRSFTFRELHVSTDGFSSKNILGAGGFGNVYRGNLGEGTMVAVKRLKDVNGTTGDSQFRTELEMISLAVHMNLLRLIGYCKTSSERLLVYTYMINGSVALKLKSKPALDWTMRKKIAIGAARGLLYLHEQCYPKIIHRDVKAANILLDECFEAVVGDFGFVKLLNHEDSHSSEKTDVFGFGILLLELITGLRALEFGKTASQKGAILEWSLVSFSSDFSDMVVESLKGKLVLLSTTTYARFVVQRVFDSGSDASVRKVYSEIVNSDGGLDVLIINPYDHYVVKALLRRLTELNSTLFKIIAFKVLERAAEHEKHEFAVHVLRECRYSFTLYFSPFYLLCLMFMTDCFRSPVNKM